MSERGKGSLSFRAHGKTPAKRREFRIHTETNSQTSKGTKTKTKSEIRAAQTLPPSTTPAQTTAIMSSTVQSVQCFGKKKTATAVAHCKAGKGLIKVNGQPLSLVQPEILRFKVYEPVLILGLDKFGA